MNVMRMALFNIVKSRLHLLSLTVPGQSHSQRVCGSVFGIISPEQVACLPQSHTYTQTRCYKKKINIPNMKPLNFDFTEDFAEQKKLDHGEIHFKYQDIPEVSELPPYLKKLFTLEFASGKEKLEHRHMVTQDKLTSLTGPAANYERQICFLTVKIRNLMPIVQANRQNKRMKAHLYDRIAKRKKILSYLRQQDYDRFLWLLKELKITYTIPDRYHYFRKNKRALEKQKIRDDLYSEMNKKMAALKIQIEAEKDAYLKEKVATLDGINDAVRRSVITEQDVKAIYEGILTDRRKLREKHEKPKRSGWKRLNDFMEKEKERKEREKWVFN